VYNLTFPILYFIDNAGYYAKIYTVAWLM